ncbi:MAG: hypothetical protein KDE27_25295 [Planctomycetes bacterium]|nr:hypothetical protein [Planctomycetota bacterium]
MFAASFLPNFVLFVAGQAAAWFYLRTGRLLLGGIATAVLWIAADWAVVARFVFEDDGAHYRGALATMQVTAVAIVALLGFEQWRRRYSRTAKQRTALFEAGLAAYLQSAHDEATRTFRRLVRNDPWDAAAWLALGNAHRRAQHPGAARRCYRQCMRVDSEREYTDLAQRLTRRAPVVETKSAAG